MIILKIGGSIITEKSSDEPKVNYEQLDRITTEIAEAYKKMDKKLIILHGAGSYGHPIVKRTGIHMGISNNKQLVDFAETQRLQNELNTIVTGELIKKGVPAIPVQASATAIMKNGKLISMDTSVIKGFVDIGLVPVLYGVPAYDSEQKCSILSGDQIAPFLAKNLGADSIIHATDVDGIFTANPKEDKNAKLIEKITNENLTQVKNYLSGSSHTDVTSGMLGKVMELANIAKEGTKCVILNGLKEERIKKALLGEEVTSTVVEF